MKDKITYAVFRIIKFFVRLFYPKTEFIGADKIPEGPVIIVGNHAKMNAPIACELYFPGKHKTWTAGEMMHLREIPPYSYRDFWGCKPAYIKWFFKILSRTEKMMTIQMVGYDEVKRVKIHSRMFDYCESAMPLGRYSMAPVLTAEKVA